MSPQKDQIMTSTRQLIANRRNALRSTGPRGAKARQRIRLNATRHGLCAKLDDWTVERMALRIAKSIASNYPPAVVRSYAFEVARAKAILHRARTQRCEISRQFEELLRHEN